MFLIVGLGNPGSEYRNNRHNVGFMVADELISRFGLSGPKKKFESEAFDGTIGDHKVLVLKPQTYMNVSGVAVQQAIAFYKIPIGNVVVIHDELDLDPAQLKIKTGGGNAGHNGLRSIDANAGVEYKRLRFGIGHPGRKDLVSSFVLHDFAKEEKELVDPAIWSIAKNFALILDGKDSEFLNSISK